MDRVPRRVRGVSLVIAVCAIATFALPLQSVAAAPKSPTGGCSISVSSPTVGESFLVTATGLPTSSPINIWVTDPTGGSTGYPLGSSVDGTFSVLESASASGTWTYTFTGPTKQHTTVYSTCSATAS